MEISDIAASQVANVAALAQQQASMAIVKKAAGAQQQMANMIAQQVTPAKAQTGFSVYA